MKNLLTLILTMVVTTVLAQVTLDNQLILTGTDANAKISGIAEVSDAKDAVNVETLQKGSIRYAAATGSGGNYAIVLSPAVVGLTPGMCINFKANHANSGAATLNVNGLGAVPIKKNISINLVANEIANSQMVQLLFDGTNFQVISPLCVLPATPGSITGSASVVENTTGEPYSISAVPGAASYNWTVPSGASVASGQGTTSITVDFGTSSGDICVTASNSCGLSSASCLTITLTVAGKIVFITSTTYGGNLGDITGADAICQTRATAASLSGTFKAWVSSATGDARDRFTQSTDPYKLVTGTTIANDWSDLIDGTLQAPINRDEFGALQAGKLPWTGTDQTGILKVYPPRTVACQTLWSSSGTSPNNGWFGDSNSATSSWTDNSYNDCNGANPLYCFEQ